MSKTKSEIGLLALQALHVLEGDASADSNDTTIIEAAYDSVYAVLRTKHLVSWGSGDSVPEEAVDAVASLVALSRLGFFSVPAQAETDIRIKASEAEKVLTEVLANDIEKEVIPAEYF